MEASVVPKRALASCLGELGLPGLAWSSGNDACSGDWWRWSSEGGRILAGGDTAAGDSECSLVDDGLLDFFLVAWSPTWIHNLWASIICSWVTSNRGKFNSTYICYEPIKINKCKPVPIATTSFAKALSSSIIHHSVRLAWFGHENK